MSFAPKSIWRAWLPVLFWLMVISLESTSIFTQHQTGIWMTRFLYHLNPEWIAYADFLNHVGRKAGHFTGYSVLSALAYRACRITFALQAEQRLLRMHGFISDYARFVLRTAWSNRSAAIACLATMCVAMLDEWHQSFLPERTGVSRDVILDTMGAVFSQLVLLTFSKNFNREKHLLSPKPDVTSPQASPVSTESLTR